MNWYGPGAPCLYTDRCARGPAFAQVYKAKDINTGDLVALKKTRLDVRGTALQALSGGRLEAAPVSFEPHGHADICGVRASPRADGGRGCAVHNAARGVAPSHAQREQPHRQVRYSAGTRSGGKAPTNSKG
eukprot:365376-Chlamydomonas_euryale.AAC.6